MKLTPFWNSMTVTYTSQTFCESPLFMPTDVQSTNGPWMNPGQAINYVTWHRISTVRFVPHLLVAVSCQYLSYFYMIPVQLSFRRAIYQCLRYMYSDSARQYQYCTYMVNVVYHDGRAGHKYILCFSVRFSSVAEQTY